jgi:HlyD family secretion protein
MNSPQTHTRRHWLRWFLLLSVVALAAFALAGFLRGPKVAVYQAVRSDLVQTIVASGKVTTPQRVEVGSQVTGRVAAIPVAEGQTVRGGQTLIVLDAGEARAGVDQAVSAVRQAEARLRQLREVGLPAAEQALRQAEATAQQITNQHARTKKLYADGFVGKAQMDDAQRNLEVAQSQSRAAQLQVQTNSRDGSDYQLAQTTLLQAQANLKLAQARLDYTLIRAPADGTLTSRNVEPGNVVQPGKVLMGLAPFGETQLVVQIDEKNLAYLKLGQPALASADAYPGERFKAELAYINPAVDPLRGSVEVKLRAPAPPAYLRQDMTVSVEIEVARRAKTVVLPSDAVRDAASAKPWVMTVQDGRAKRQPVRIGIRSDGKVEILEGLQPGTLVIPAGSSGIKEGQRVRPLK